MADPYISDAGADAARPLTRRAFVRHAATLAGALALAPRLRVAGVALRLTLVEGSDAAAADRARGVVLGVDEAQRAAQLFGGSVSLSRVAAGRGPVGDVARRAGPGAVLLADPASCAAMAEAARAAELVCVNLASPDDALRADCRAALFHVPASAAMRRATLAQWLADPARSDWTATAGGERAAHPSGAVAEVVEWDPSLDKFGAAELGQRYARRFGAPMSAAAWVGWAGVKGLWETALRAGTAAPAPLAAALAADATQFDGHKGVPLSFQRATHQLRQPLYVLQREPDGRTRVVGELPHRTAGTPTRELLDGLAPITAGAAACR